MFFNPGFIEKLRWRINLLQHKFTQYRLSTNETSTVDTEDGQVRGLKYYTLYGETYYSFEGIPYAKPPLGELRFKAPEKPDPWKGVLDCYAMKSKAPQFSGISMKVEGSEDCLYLSVYTRNVKPNKPAPVMFWIHGGGFIFGEANRIWYGPDYFMEKDVVLVSVQYRLGSLGFLNLSSPELNVPGNAGLKDAILALNWVKNNISNFGGDPNCITVFGESAGGTLTHYMCITEKTKDLFHRAIIMSGTANAYWANNGAEQNAFRLAQLAGYKGENDDKQVLDYLMQCKAEVLVPLQLAVKEDPRKLSFAFAPCIEQYDTPHSVIRTHPRELMKTTWSNSIPIVVGSVAEEGLLMTTAAQLNPSLLKDLETCKNFVPDELPDKTGLEENAAKLKKIHANSGKLLTKEFTDIHGHLIFYFPQHCLVRSRLAYAPKAPTYVYRFDFDSELIAHAIRIWTQGRGSKGVGHGNELTYLFTHPLSYRLPKQSHEYKTIQRMVGIWTKFAVTGDPNSKEIPGMESINWQPVKDAEPAYKCLNITDELEVKDWPEMEKCKVWESLFEGKKELIY